MAASILAPGISTIYNVPDISDVRVMGEVLKEFGAQVVLSDHSVSIDTTLVSLVETPSELGKEMRASVALLGALIGRFGKARVAMPGGCEIGSRKLDQHYRTLKALGVCFNLKPGIIDAQVTESLRGAHVKLEFPSVGVTENLMMAAVKAQGTTSIENAAREPEIVDLANFLRAMGAQIKGAGSPQITIEGTDRLSPVQGYKTVGDRIEAGTFLIAGALGYGPVTVSGVAPENLAAALAVLKEMGVEVSMAGDSITVRREGSLKAVTIETAPHPGFPTDLQAQFAILAILAQGESTITENIFEDRFGFVGELVRMGAGIYVEDRQAHINGVARLSGAPVQAPDLRGGAALVLAGLIANGRTDVSGIEHIERGYENFVKKLQDIGAHIERHG